LENKGLYVFNYRSRLTKIRLSTRASAIKPKMKAAIPLALLDTPSLLLLPEGLAEFDGEVGTLLVGLGMALLSQGALGAGPLALMLIGVQAF
jgi:hypothetical protein